MQLEHRALIAGCAGLVLVGSCIVCICAQFIGICCCISDQAKRLEMEAAKKIARNPARSAKHHFKKHNSHLHDDDDKEELEESNPAAADGIDTSIALAIPPHAHNVHRHHHHHGHRHSPNQAP